MPNMDIFQRELALAVATAPYLLFRLILLLLYQAHLLALLDLVPHAMVRHDVQRDLTTTSALPAATKASNEGARARREATAGGRGDGGYQQEDRHVVPRHEAQRRLGPQVALIG
jgi:hypothetical protein